MNETQELEYTQNMFQSQDIEEQILHYHASCKKIEGVVATDEPANVFSRRIFSQGHSIGCSHCKRKYDINQEYVECGLCSKSYCIGCGQEAVDDINNIEEVDDNSSSSG